MGGEVVRDIYEVISFISPEGGMVLMTEGTSRTAEPAPSINLFVA